MFNDFAWQSRKTESKMPVIIYVTVLILVCCVGLIMCKRDKSTAALPVWNSSRVASASYHRFGKATELGVDEVKSLEASLVHMKPLQTFDAFNKMDGWIEYKTDNGEGRVIVLYYTGDPAEMYYCANGWVWRNAALESQVMELWRDSNRLMGNNEQRLWSIVE
jgi:hypothetical protein